MQYDKVLYTITNTKKLDTEILTKTVSAMNTRTNTNLNCFK